MKPVRMLFPAAIRSPWRFHCVLALSMLVPDSTHAQSSANPLEQHTEKAVEGAQAPSKSGSNTGGAYPAVLGPDHRPITIGGTVPSGPVPFLDVTAKAGLAAWRHVSGSPDKGTILEAIGSGVALLDYDNDGWLDIYLVNGSTQTALAGTAPAPRAALFHNNHDGTFTDVTARAGVDNKRWGFGAVVGDFDNDGWPDIYVTNFGKNRLYRNNHDGTFTDVAEHAGVALGGWSTGATWGDFDGDGRLDLFVPGYVKYDPAHPPEALPGAANLAFCSFRGVRVYCGPHGLPGEPDHLFHNNGDGTFTDVSEHAGVADKPGYYGLASAFIDVNNDGKPDLLVANDSTPNYLYLNKGDGTFDDASYASGYALNSDGRETASMGIALGDYRNNGLIDVFNTTFSDDYKPLYRNDGDANFTDSSAELHIAEGTIPFLGWGTAFFDYDNDGWKDLAFVNGHVYRSADQQPWGTTWAERMLLFHNVVGKLLEPVPAVTGTALATPRTSRGMAVGDLFNTGRLDLVINNIDSPPTLLRNSGEGIAATNHWVELHLVGSGKSPRDAIGATVYLMSRGTRQRADVVAGGSFASSSDPRLHFGLGTSAHIDSIEVHWPDGTKEPFTLPGIDAIYTLLEGRGVQITDSEKH